MAESRVSRADRRADAMRRRIGEEVRVARLAAGLTLGQVAAAIGISESEASRIERGTATWVDMSTLARMAAVVGLDLWVRTYPGGDPLRDAAHLELARVFRAMVGSELLVRGEVRVGDQRDLRAWDLTLTDPHGEGCGVELETRFVDVQAQHRRIARKLEDSDLDRVLVVVADTRANRSAVRAAVGLLGTAYAVDDRAAIDALAEGRLPPRSALIFVRSHGPGRSRSDGSCRPTGAGDARDR